MGAFRANVLPPGVLMPLIHHSCAGRFDDGQSHSDALSNVVATGQRNGVYETEYFTGATAKWTTEF